MEKISSFTVDHLKLTPGVYVSRKDRVGENIITTFDLRMVRPNFNPVINTAELHAIEHLGATFLRNDKHFGEKIIYFGPMGCRTGYYLIINGDYQPDNIIQLLINLCKFITEYDGDIPGAAAEECGNYLDMNLPMARHYAEKYLNVLTDIKEENMRYPK